MSDGDERGTLVVLRGGNGHVEEPALEPVPELVALLETLLEEARRGEIVSGMFVGERHDDRVRSGWTNGFDYLKRIGAIESMKHDWLVRLHLEDVVGRDL